MKWFRLGLEFKAHRRVYHSTLGSRVIKKKRKRRSLGCGVQLCASEDTCTVNDFTCFFIWVLGHGDWVRGLRAFPVGFGIWMSGDRVGGLGIRAEGSVQG